MGFGAATTLIADFNFPDQFPLSAGGTWSKLNNFDGVDLQIAGLSVTAQDPTTASSYYNVQQFGPDVDVFMTVSVKPPDGENAIICARLKDVGSGAWDGYQVRLTPAAGTDSVVLIRVTNSVGTILDTKTREFTSGDKLGIRCQGSTIESWAHTSSGWSRLSSVTDTTWPNSGFVGIRASTVVTRLDDVYAGPIAAEDVLVLPIQSAGHGFW